MVKVIDWEGVHVVVEEIEGEERKVESSEEGLKA
jgi:hypothetical protein